MRDDYNVDAILAADPEVVEDPLDFVYSANRICFASEEPLEEGACYGEQERSGNIECNCISRHLPWDPNEDSRARALMVGAQRRLQGLPIREIPGENEPEIPEGVTVD